MKQNITKPENFEIPINPQTGEFNLDELESKLIEEWNFKSTPSIWHKVKPTPKYFSLNVYYYSSSIKKEFKIHVKPNKLSIIRGRKSKVTSSNQLCHSEFLLLKALKKEGTLKKIFEFYTDELYPVVKQHPKDFNWKLQYDYFYGTIDPLERIGKVLLPSDVKVFPKNLQRVESFTKTSEVLCYCISNHQSSSGYPALKAFLGRTTLDQENIRSFITFKQGQITPLLPELTENQLSLLKIAERIEEISELQEMEKELWALWERAIELLKQEKFVFRFNSYNKRHFINGPQKMHMKRIVFSDEAFQPAFHLIENQDSMILKPFMLQQEKWLEVEHTFPRAFPMFFGANRYEPPIFATGSIHDSRVWKWAASKMALTIHRIYGRQFQEEILPELSTLYPFKFKFKTKGELEIQKQKLTIEKKWIQVSQSNDFVTLTPIIKYLEKENPTHVLTQGTQWVLYEGEKRIIQLRNKKEENAMKRFIQDLHPSFKNQTSKDFLKLSMEEFLEDYWFLEAFSKLKNAEITIEGMERFEGFDYHPYRPDLQVDVTTDKGWFDIGLQVKFGNMLVDMEQLKKAVFKGKGMIKLESGKKGVIPSEMQDKLRGLLAIGQNRNGKLSLATVHYPMLEKLYGKNAPKDITAWIKTKRKRLENPVSRGMVKLPKVNAELRPYQKSGFQWLKALQEEQWGGILADDMGLGKTLQVLTLLLHTKETGGKRPNLIVATKTLLYNWEEQAAKFTTNLSVCKYYGNYRAKLQKRLDQYDLVITTYDTIKSDISFFGKMNFQYLITDEAQAIKNSDTDRYKAINLINAQYRLAITGTPIENSIMDLYALMNFVNPGFFGTQANFRKMFLERGRADKTPKIEALQAAVKPFILRRTKDKVAKDLPEKTEMVLYCEMDTEQRKTYETLRKYYKGEFEEQVSKEGENYSQMKVLEGLMRLRQVCDHPLLVPDYKDYKGGSAKMDALMQQVTEKADNHKVLIFSQFTGMLKLIRQEMEKYGIAYSYLDGQTSEASRKMAVENFQEDDSIRVFLLSLKAGGSGLNLTAGDYVFLVDPWWNPAVESQAIDRCYRIGQDKNVMAYRMICKDTVEEKILQMQTEKKKLASGMIQSEQGLFKSLDTKGLLELFG